MSKDSLDTHPLRVGVPIGRGGMRGALDESQAHHHEWEAERAMHRAIQLMTPHREAYTLHFEQELKDVGPVGVRIGDRFMSTRNGRRLAHCPKQLWFLPPLLINVVQVPGALSTPRAMVMVMIHGTERRSDKATGDINPFRYERPHRITSKQKVPQWLSKLLFLRLESTSSEFSKAVNLGMKLIDGKPLYFMETYQDTLYDTEYRYMMTVEPKDVTVKGRQHQLLSHSIRYVPTHVIPWLVTQLKQALRPVAEEMLIREFYSYSFPPPSHATAEAEKRDEVDSFFDA